MKIQSVILIGLGAVGIMYAKQICDTLGPDILTVCADKERITRYRTRGIYANGELCDFRYRTYDEVTEPADLVLFATKYIGFPDASRAAAPCIGPNTILVSMLNGIVSEQDLEALYGPEHLLYCSVQGMDTGRVENQVKFRQLGYIALGEKDGSQSEQLLAVKDLFDRAGIDCRLPENILHHQWSKMMLNSGINTVTAVNNCSYDEVIHTPELLAEMIGAMREVQTVARCEGIELTDKEIDEWVWLVGTLTPGTTTSMCQDVRAHRKTEIGLFSGTVDALGKKYGIPTPISSRLCEQIREIEENYPE